MQNGSISSRRSDAFRGVNGVSYDIAIFGAGISGARIFYELCEQGYRVLLLDRGDFASGTSQASGMMIWGGLLYLKDIDLWTVKKLCRARDELIERMPNKVRVESMRYLTGRKSLRNRHVVFAGMMLYWLIGSWKRRFPKSEYFESEMLKPDRFRDSLAFDEAVLKTSDCRFALEWILPFMSSESPALNHCETEKASFDVATGRWHLELRDRLCGNEAAVTARYIVNAAGVWTDTVNRDFGIESPFRHDLSKGVYLSIKRPVELSQILVFDTGENDDTLTMVPWGPVAMCGPTETRITDLRDGFQANVYDVRSLLKLSNQNLRNSYNSDDIVSLRCGIRPLAVTRDFNKPVHPLELSRKHLLHFDRSKNAVAVYGGKLTSCGDMAKQVRDMLSPHFKPVQKRLPRILETPLMESFPGLDEPVIAAQWCRDHENCHTLEDYLRRRSNIAQWIPRGGLGKNLENLQTLRGIARIFSDDATGAEKAILDYQEYVRKTHDEVLAAVVQILRDGNVSTHPVIRELEKDYAAFTGRKHALAHNSGTSALLAAFHALDLQPGDEILVPTATFWASVLPMIWCGLVPVFCESENATLGIDPEDMRRKITSRTRAVVIVHLWGLPCAYDEIRRVCDEFDLRIIEDASHAHGASDRGRKCGTLGDISVFSLQGDKLAPAGEGGIFLTDNAEYLERATGLGDITRIIELPTAARRFAATGMGIKTRIAPLSAALGRVSLKKLSAFNRLRNENHRWLSGRLEAMGFDCFLPADGIERVYFEFLIRHRDAGFETARFIKILQSFGAQVSVPRYPLLHQQPFFREGYLEKIGRLPTGLALPDYPNLEFPNTESENSRLIKLPNFCHNGADLLEQYRLAFETGLIQMTRDQRTFRYRDSG